MVLNVANIFPGREQDYMNVMKNDFFPHFDAEEMNYMSGVMSFGGTNGFVHVTYIDNFAELDRGSPVMRALGSDGAQAVNAKLSGIVTKSELWVARVLDDASYSSLPEETESP